jgi:hypothetical protein
VETHAVGVGEVLQERKAAAPRVASRPVHRSGSNVEVIKGSQVSVQSF